MENLIEELRSSSEKMLQYNTKALERLLQVQQDENYKADFFGEVKPYVDQFTLDLEKWSQLCLEWIQQKKPRYIHRMQVDTAKDNLHQVVLQSFYRADKMRRFKQMHQANEYVIKSILEEI